ncbi:DHA2 family efflux MFS transporter permease subunit [Rhodopila sp.]|jgi:DHA2 family multidrug resistance protein|uniref:DHA2 family efflux MFS transporter permease subunit n=1 Tax=Rhodopila sp. TaxID=2480087 RepID=UPI002C3F5A79|nr:DHA2 family efflux MFS transporter permease subunit [Rhodopila sp.]HVZ06528.1 DHA2 family efflux MFS transporter permease subunit [Rhodopila sp.]
MEGETQPVPYRGLITVCAMMATLMQSLDSTIANVALPYMQGSLSASSDQITWVLTSYITAAAIMTAPVGWLSARFGLKRLYLISMIGFTAASMLCGIAGSLPEMVAFRLLQGVFGAALVPLSQSTMLNIYPPEKRGSAMAAWGMGVMVGPILGPTLGGYLTELYNWRWVFFVNLPFGVLATAGMAAFLPNTEPSYRKFDWVGFGALALGIGGLQLMLDRGETKDWFGSTEIILEATAAAVGFYLFIVHMMTAERPFITPRVFKDRNLTAGLLVMFAVGMVLLAVSALLAPWLQNLADYPVATAGLAMAPRGVGTMMAMLVAGRLSNKVDPRALMAAGILVLAYSLYRMTGWTPAVDDVSVIINTMLQGAGLGLVFVPLQVIAFATLEPALRTEGTALLSLVRNVGSAIGISVTSALVARTGQIEHSVLAGYITPLNRAFEGAAAPLMPTTSYGAQVLDAMINQQAQIIAYNNDWKLMMLTALPMLLLLPLMRRPQATGGAKAEHAVME